MAGWLDAAVRVFRREPSEEPESTLFSVVCACSRPVTGTRRGEWQRTQCPFCGEILFVLPTNVYPRPRRRPAPKKPAEPAVKRRPPSGEIIPDWGPPAQPAEKASPGPRAAVKDPGPPPVEMKPTGFTLPRRRFVTRIRLLMVSILAVVAVTGWLVVRAQRRERADVTLRTGAPRVEEEMAAGNLLAAEGELRRVVESLDVLGRADEEAAGHRQLLRELSAINGLAPVSLFDLLREAEQHLTRTDAEWGRHFGTFHGKWILLDAPVFRTRDPAGAEVVVVDAPLSVGRHPFRIVADLRAFDALGLSEEPRPALFAAQLESCRLPTDEDPSVVLRLNPDTGFLWQGEQTWLLAGMGDENPDQQAALKRRLAEQRRIAGGAP